jgi:dTDP-4-amino-4,6-dideoxygalactose transaminase
VANVGRKRHGEWYGHITLASNYRLSEWAGAVLRVQLTRLDEQAELRSANAAYLAEAMSEVKGLQPLQNDPRVTRNAYHLFKIWYEPEQFGGRTTRDFAAAMRAEGVPVSNGYLEPLSETKVVVERSAYISNRLGLPQVQADCPVAREACQRGLWFFQSNLLGTRRDMDDVIQAAIKIQRAWR